MRPVILALSALLLATGACSLFAPKAPTRAEKCEIAKAACARVKSSEASKLACAEVAATCGEGSGGDASQH